MGRLIDVETLIGVLLEEREHTDEIIRFETISDCIAIINHMPEYSDKKARIDLTVGDVNGRFLTTSDVAVVLKREDNGSEYRKIKDALDEKNNWQVTGFMPRIKAYGTRADIELVLWCQDRNTDIKELRDELICDKFGTNGSIGKVR